MEEYKQDLYALGRRQGQARGIVLLQLASVLLRRGESSLQHRQPELALDDFEELLNLKLGSIELETQAQHGKALCFKQMGKPGRALMFLNQLIAENPHFLDAYFSRSQLFLESKQISQGIRDLSHCISHHFRVEESIVLRAQAFMHLRPIKIQEAIFDLERLLTINPSNLNVFNLLSTLRAQVAQSTLPVTQNSTPTQSRKRKVIQDSESLIYKGKSKKMRIGDESFRASFAYNSPYLLASKAALAYPDA